MGTISDNPGDWFDEDAYQAQKAQAKPYVPEPEPKCPTCHGPMRFMGQGKWGDWWSCKAYPKCRGSMKDADWKRELASRLPGM